MSKEFRVSSSEFGVKGKIKGGESMSKKEVVSREGETKNQKGGFMRIVLGLLLVVMFAGFAQAVTTDSVLLTITPVFNLSVNISSATNTFGSAIGVRSSVTICVGTIYNDGNVSTKWQKQTGIVSGSAGTAWSLKTSGTPGTDEFRLLAISTGTATSPSFAGTAADSCIIGDHDAIGVLAASATDLTEGGAASPNHPTGETRRLWASIMMPTNISSGLEQTISLSIRAIAP